MIDLKLEQLTFEYDDHQLFDELNFQLQPGTFGLLTGPSGCGTVSYTHLTLPTT